MYLVSLSTAPGFDLSPLFRENGPETISAGRRTDCAWIIDLPENPCLLSREHATFTALGQDRVCVRDLNSTNGT